MNPNRPIIPAPEGIEIAVCLFSLCSLGIGYLVFHSTAEFRSVQMVSVLLSVSAGLLMAHIFVRDLKRTMALLAVDTAIVAVLITELQLEMILLNVLLVGALVMNITMRLPLRMSLPAGVSVIALSLLAIEIAVAEPIELLLLAVVEISILGLCAVVIWNRERVARAHALIESQEAAIRNISQANQALVDNLPDMRRQTEERERLRITRELHDALGYSVTNIVSMMNATEFLVDSDTEKLMRFCRKTKELASGAMKDIRDTLYRLRSIDDHAKDNPSVFFRTLCRDFQEATGVATECHSGNLVSPLDDHAFTFFLRVLQVGLINALRYGDGDLIRVYFWVGSLDRTLTIWNSSGISEWDVLSGKEGIGLQGLRERLSPVGGVLVAGPVSNGYSLSVSIPLEITSDERDPGPDS